jgi:hypothetical protein
MGTLGGADGAARRVALGGIVAGLVIGLAACGTVVAGASSPAKPATGVTAPPGKINPGGPMLPASTVKHVLLCTQIPGLTRLSVTSTAWPHGYPRFPAALPTGFVALDPAAVRRVATILCGLPRMPAVAMSCPNLFGGSYRAHFTAGARVIPPVTIQLSGCRVVTGLGPARTWARSGQLAQALSLGSVDSVKRPPLKLPDVKRPRRPAA